MYQRDILWMSIRLKNWFTTSNKLNISADNIAIITLKLPILFIVIVCIFYEWTVIYIFSEYMQIKIKNTTQNLRV